MWDIAWFDDIDWNLHMNNSSYFKHFDFGRYHYGAKTLGVIKMFTKISYVASSHARYIKAVKPLTIFRIETEPIYIGKKWWLLQQRLISSQGVHCIAVFKIVFKHHSGKTITSYELIPDELNEKVFFYYKQTKPFVGDDKLFDCWESLETEGNHFYNTNLDDDKKNKSD